MVSILTLKQQGEIKVYCGIDPGLTGGLVMIDLTGDVKFQYAFPTIEVKKGRKMLDLRDIALTFKTIEKFRPTCFIEKVSAMPKQGVSSVFKFGQTYGALEAFINASLLSYHLVTPQAWTKVIHKGLDKKMKAKDRSLAVFKRSYPGLDFRPSKRHKKHHEGLIDALLIAEYGRRIND